MLLRFVLIVFWASLRNLFVLGAASTARAFSTYFDSLFDFAMKKYFTIHFPLHLRALADYADLFAAGVCLIITGTFKSILFFSLVQVSTFLVLLVIGIKESAVLNNIFTAINLTVTLIVIIVGLTKIQGHNWNISPDEVCL